MLYSQAVAVRFDRTLDDGTRVYTGTLDPFWTIGVVPHGGYVMGCILEAVLHSQSTTRHPDPIHISSYFLVPSRPEAYEVHIRQLRAGRRFSNLVVDFFQKGQMNLTSHVIVGTLPDPAVGTDDRSSPTMIPPHPFATRIPFREHPSISEPFLLETKVTPRSLLKTSFDRTIEERFLTKAIAPWENDGGFDRGEWYEMLGEEKGVRLSLPAIAFLADMGRSPPELFPEGDRPGLSWFPTLTLSLEFKVKLSCLPHYISPHTFGIFSTGRFIHQGRHDLRSEVWTAPSTIGEKGVLSPDDEEWRDKMFCVAVSNQVALTVPIDVNRRKASTQSSTQTNGNRPSKL